MLCSMANLILLLFPSELMNHVLRSYLYSVCDSAGMKLEKVGETESPSLIKYLTSIPPLFYASPQMGKQTASFEPIVLTTSF